MEVVEHWVHSQNLMLHFHFLLNPCLLSFLTHCHCYKRERSGEEENLVLSNQCHSYIDNMSDEDESDTDTEGWSSSSDAGLSDFEDFDFE